MSPKEFSPQGWREKKYGKQQLDFLSPAEYQIELQHIIATIKFTLQTANQEFLEDFGSGYDIVAAIIYGSFARGDVHSQSDLDICVAAIQEPHNLVEDFIDRLTANNVGRYISPQDTMRIILRDTPVKTYKELARLGTQQLFSTGKIIVAPDPNVASFVRQTLG